MILVDAGTEAKIVGNNRKFSSSIQMDYLSLRFDSTVAILAPNSIDGSIPDQLVDQVLRFETNRFFAGVTLPALVFPSLFNIFSGAGYVPRRTLYKTKVGYVGPLAGPTGEINDIVGVRISPRLIQTVKIETAPGRVLIDFTVTIYTETREVLATRNITGNSLTSLVLEFPELAKPATYYELSITKSTPGKRLWIGTFAPHLVLTYGDNDIIKWTHQTRKAENADASVGRVYIQSFSLQLFNGARAFDYLNTASRLFGALKPNVEITADLALGSVSFPVGVFYAQTWDPPESDASVTIKAVDLLGKVKDNRLDAVIVDEISAAEAFALVASKLGLNSNAIDPALASITLHQFGLGDTAGNILNELCTHTLSWCWVNKQGTGLIVKRVVQLKGRARYPSRYFGTGDYATAKFSASDPAPTILEVDYTLQEYEQDEIILAHQEKLYSDLPLRTYPPALTLVPTYNREIGAGQPPSWISDAITKPTGFTRILFSDAFQWSSLEYSWEDLGDGTVKFKVWNFDNTSVDDQLTAQLVGYAANPNQQISDTTETIPSRPGEYRAQLVSDDVSVRNSPNRPYEFSVELDDKVSISSIVPGNVQRPGLFEFTIEPTAFGCKCRVWNYLNSEQDFEVLIYGRKLTNTSESKTLTLRDDVGIRSRGEITKQVSLSDMNDAEMARLVAVGMQAYYRTFVGKADVEPWSDPRLQVGDQIAVDSIRGYGFVPVLVDEMSTDYNGALTQKLTTLQIDKHNRDCRMIGGHVLRDRPMSDRTVKGYV